MQFQPKLLGAIATISLLTACGGGGDNEVVYSSYAVIEAAKDAMEATYAGAATTDTGDLPASGTATYDGFVGGAVDDGAGGSDDIIGQLSLTADFQADDIVDGRAYNFLRDDNTAIGGELSLDNGSILDNAGSAEITATLSGDLDGQASSMLLNGDFVAGAQAVDGTATGLIGGNLFTGDFIAER